MSDNLSENEQEEIELEADNIATTITNILVGAFKLKEGRDPTNDEIEMLFEELTEERIAEMLGESVAAENISDKQIDESDDEQNDNDEEEEEVETVALESELLEGVPELNADNNDENLESVTKKRRLSDNNETSGVELTTEVVDNEK